MTKQSFTERWDAGCDSRPLLEEADREIERLQEILNCPRITPDADAEQFKAVLDACDKGEPVNGQDLINALHWRVRNQRRELARKNQDVERLRNDIQELTCGDPRLVSQANREAFKNFHRLLCERFGYGHDEVHWERDQLSLIEWIAKRIAHEPTADSTPLERAFSQEPQATIVNDALLKIGSPLKSTAEWYPDCVFETGCKYQPICTGPCKGPLAVP